MNPYKDACSYGKARKKTFDFYNWETELDSRK